MHLKPSPGASLLAPLLVLVATGALCSCSRDSEEAGILRLGDLIPRAAAGEAQIVALDVAVAAEMTVFVDVDIDAARYDALELEAQGAAKSVQLGWKLASEGRMQPYRRLDFPLLGEAHDQAYRIDLQREPYWSGRVSRLAITARGGGLEVAAVHALPARTPYRDMALGGVSVPSLPGLRRIELPLGDAWSSSGTSGPPRRARFESLVGIVPQYDLEGTRAEFRVFLEIDGDERIPWASSVVEAAGRRGGGVWQRIEAEVEIPDRGTLVLESRIERRGGGELAEGTTVWGNPLLVWGRPPERLNLVVILVDTLRADAVGAFGARHRLTPEIDALAARSVKLDNLFAPSPWTLPSAASLLTGLHPQTHGAGQRIEGFAPTGLTEGPLTLSEVLGAAGYYTSGIYNNIYLNTAFGLQQGFDRYATFDETADLLVDRALEELAAARDRPLFLFLHLFDPHNPYSPPAEDCARVLGQLLGNPTSECTADRRPDLPIPSPGDRPRIEALYHAEIAFTDREIGRLLDGIEALGLAERTVVALVSDHGEDFWQRLPQQEAYGYRSDADHGHTHYRELLRVPGLLHVPGQPPSVLRRAAELVDLYPTLLGLLGVEAPPNQGRDLRPALNGESLKTPLLLSDLLLYGRPRWAVQEGNWRLVAPHAGEVPVELFDLARDPEESDNLAHDHPETVERLLRLGRREIAERAEMRAALFGADEGVSATYLEWRHITKLRALGYLE